MAAASAAWQSLAPTRLHIEQVNLPKFDGKDFLLFHKQFDAVVKEQRWSPETCARKLLESLEGDTRRHVEVSMDYDEMLEALRQYYAGSRPSIEAKNILRHFNKNKDESIEEFASRIQACADGARLTSFNKLKYMQEAFMNGLRNDTKMQRYIEKRTSQHENVHIVKLLKAAQDYLHDKQGSTQPNPTGKAKLNSHKPKGKKQNSDGASEGQPKANVMKGGRKEPLSHDDPAVEQEVEEEQEKAQQSKGGKNKQGSSAWKKRYEEAEKRSNELRDQLQKAIETVTQQAQIQQQQTANFQNRGGNYRNNNWGGNSNYNQRNDNFRNNNGYRNNTMAVFETTATAATEAGVMGIEVVGATIRITRTLACSIIRASTTEQVNRQDPTPAVRRPTRLSNQLRQAQGTRQHLRQRNSASTCHRRPTATLAWIRVYILRTGCTPARMTIVKPDYRRAPTPTCKRVARWETARRWPRGRRGPRLRGALVRNLWQQTLRWLLLVKGWESNLFVLNTVNGNLCLLPLLRRVARKARNICQDVVGKIAG